MVDSRSLGDATSLPGSASALDQPHPLSEARLDQPGGSPCVCLSNVSDDITEADLRRALESRGPVRSVTFIRGRARGSRKKHGRAFVEFAAADDAEALLASATQLLVCGQRLLLEPAIGRAARSDMLADGTGDEDQGTAEQGASAKLLVRNVAFQATGKELRELLSTYGLVKSVRLPKRFNGRHRGFAFVEFSSKAEAARAKRALSSTHFYGRHLVLEFAHAEEQEEEEVE